MRLISYVLRKMRVLKLGSVSSCLKAIAKAYSTKPLQQQYDIVVVGGGMVGFGFTAFAGILFCVAYTDSITPYVKK